MSSLSSSLSKYPKTAAAIHLDPDPDPPPTKSTLSGFLWSSLFADSPSTNAPSSSPSYLANGTPVVIAPPSVILNASTTWAGHLLCRFLGEPPSPAKFFSDLNRVWGKFGKISVRRFSSGIFLVHFPSQSTRKWILETGLWSSGTVSFVVSEWSVNSSLAPPSKLTSAATVITIRDIPPQLWSQEGVNTIAGGVAKLIPGTRASLPLSSLGTTTIRAIVPLGSPLPSSVLVKDSNGDSVLVSIDYGRLPHLCSLCSSYGHQPHRCPLRPSATKPIPPKANFKVSKTSDPEPNLEVISTRKTQEEDMVIDQVVDPLTIEKSPSNAPVSAAKDMDLVVPEALLHVPEETALLHAPEETAQSSVIDSMACDVSDHIELAQIDADAKPNSPQPNHNIELGVSVLQQNESMDIVSDLPSSNTPLVTSPVQASEEVEKATETDNMASVELRTECASNPPPVPASSYPLLSESKMLQAPIHAPEVGAQVTETDSMACDDRITECVSAPHVSISQSSDPSQVHLSSSTADPILVPALTCPSPSPNTSEPLAENKHLTISHNNSSSIWSNEPGPASTSFSFPPPVNQALVPKTDHISSPQIQSSLLSMSTTVKKKENKDNSKDKPDTKLLLRCKTPHHHFKPKGILEKRRKRAQNDSLLEAEELSKGIQELQSDKKDTTYYEAIKALKVLQKLDSELSEARET